MPKKVKKECPDCKGSGKYVGLSVVEDCRLCKGSGEVLAELENDRRKRKAKRLLQKAKQKAKKTKTKTSSSNKPSFPRGQPGLQGFFKDIDDYFTDPDASDDDDDEASAPTHNWLWEAYD